MTQEDKELLFIDLCGRIPYKVRMFEIEPINDIQSNLTLLSITNKESVICITPSGGVIGSSIDAFKPYLFPLSSMTDEQFVELKVFADLTYEGNTLELVEWNDNCKTLEFWLEEIPSYELIKVFDWLNKNHFDYRGLIPMGLAIDATGLNIY